MPRTNPSSQSVYDRVEHCQVLEANGIARNRAQAALQLGWPIPPEIDEVISYMSPATGRLIKHRIQVTTTRPHYGGVRVWFVCGCGRRCGKLYLPPDGDIYRCRRCYGLAYTSQRVSPTDRLWRRVGAICRRLGAVSGTSLKIPAKPKGMHWRTYQRLRRDAEETCAPLLSEWTRRFPPLSVSRCNSDMP